MKETLMTATRKAELDEQHANAVAYQVDSPVNLGQLDAEVAEATGWGPGRVIVEGGRTEGSIVTPTEESPVHVWVVGEGEGDTRTVGAVLREHTADPAWGQTEVSIEALAEKVRSGGALNEVESAFVIEQLLKERVAE